MVANSCTLYVDSQYFSPYAMCVYVALKEKGLAFDIQCVDLEAGEQARGNVAQQLPTRRVPTLVHNGFTLAESTAIAEYLEALYPQVPLYPAEVQARAQARQIQAWLRSDLLALREERTTEVMFARRRRGALSTQGQAAAEKLFGVAEALLPLDADNLFGQWTLADLDLAIMLNRLVSHGDDVPPRLLAYTQRQWQRPSVQAWLRLTG